MNIELIPSNDLRPSRLPRWLISFIRNWMALVAIALLIITIVIHANFYDMGETGLYIVMTFLGLFFLNIFLMSLGVGYQHRYVNKYIHETAGYDMQSSRKYTKLNYNWFQRFYTTFRKELVLSVFAYENENVYVMTANGQEFEAPLKDIFFTYETSRNINTTEVIFTFILQNPTTEESIKFTKIPNLLEEEEWEDILNILARSNFKRKKGKSIVQKSASLLLNLLQGEISGSTRGLDNAANNSFSKVAGMKVYD